LRRLKVTGSEGVSIIFLLVSSVICGK